METKTQGIRRRESIAGAEGIDFEESSSIPERDGLPVTLVSGSEAATERRLDAHRFGPFGFSLELPPSDCRSHIRANQEKIIANAEDAEAERRLPASQNGRGSG